LAIGPDNKLYFEVGQPGNNVLHDKDHDQLRRINLDGSGAEVIAFGIRNTVGFDWNPKSKELNFTDNGCDWFSEDLPNDKLNRITKVGQDFTATRFLSPATARGTRPTSSAATSRWSSSTRTAA
jgi:glucose/arabinose dehydrogenase